MKSQEKKCQDTVASGLLVDWKIVYNEYVCVCTSRKYQAFMLNGTNKIAGKGYSQE